MRTAHVLGASALLAVGLAVAAPSVSAADASTSADCVADDGMYSGVWTDVADSLIVTVTNCTSVVVYDIDGNTAGPVALGASDTVTIPGGGYADFASSDTSTGFHLEAFPIFPEHTPSGQLLLTADATIDAEPLVFDAGADTDGGDHALAGNPQCYLGVYSGSEHVYGIIEITIAKAGKYTFRNVTTDPVGGYEGDTYHPIADPFFALYSSFDPTSPDDGVVGCSDDLNDRFGYDNASFMERTGAGDLMEGHRPYFSARLEPGTYTLLYTTYEPISLANWLSGNEGEYAVGAATGTFEMWGPADSICLSSDTACVEEQAAANNPTTVPAEIPATGSSSGTSLWVALMAVVVGAGLVMASRRSVRRA